MTPFSKVYDAFLNKILEDEWTFWDQHEVEKDLRGLLMGAIPNFKFPKVSLEFNEKNEFLGELSNSEIQILATYMKREWLNRSILTWENIKPLYEEKDFSPGNLLDKLTKLLENTEKYAEKLESKYYRSRGGKPFDYSKLAGN